MSAELKLEGARELERVMKQLPVKMRKKHMRTAVRRGIALLRDEIKNTAPVDHSRIAGTSRAYRKGDLRPKPGRLRRLIRIKVHRIRPRYVKASLFYPTEGKGNNPKNAYYWRFLEDGTKYIAKRPFIRPAVDKKFPTIVRTVISEAKRGVEEDLRKIKTRVPT